MSWFSVGVASAVQARAAVMRSHGLCRILGGLDERYQKILRARGSMLYSLRLEMSYERAYLLLKPMNAARKTF
jgi:hypothetical protein